MIISHKHNFIFIHCRKVAGSSIAVYLSKFLGPKDIQLSAIADSKSNGVHPNLRFYLDLLNYRSTQYYFTNLVKNIFLTKEGNLLPSINAARKEKYRKYFTKNIAHPTALEIKNFDKYAWRNYFKFCFVRNPYERVLSDYFWRVKNINININFHEFVKLLYYKDHSNNIIPENFDNWKMYTINDEISVDYIGRYESLNEDFGEICDHLDIPYNGKLPLAKKIKKEYSYRD